MHISLIDSTYQTCYNLATEINLIIIKYFFCRLAFFNKSKCCQHCNRSTLINPLPDDILDSSKPKEFAYNNFEFDEIGRKLSKWVENTVGKVEILCYEQFLLFPQCFQKACFPEASKGVIVWEWVNYNSLKSQIKLQLSEITNLAKELCKEHFLTLSQTISFR